MAASKRDQAMFTFWTCAVLKVPMRHERGRSPPDVARHPFKSDPLILRGRPQGHDIKRDVRR